MAKREAKNAAGEFDAFYSQLYPNRWPALREALTAAPQQIARWNKFAVGSKPTGLARLELGSGEVFYKKVESGKGEALDSESDALKLFYIMDLASVFPALALDVRAGHRVLDLCAAPGGKSLILAEHLGQSGDLTSNELSDARRLRLLRVFREYISNEVRSQIRVTGHDGTKWGLYEANVYDRILLDAPCSGERHLLDNPTELQVWSKARGKNLSTRQYSLLASAWLALKPGGRIVYSTCSISTLENDQVIAKLAKKKVGVKILQPEFPMGEKTERGWVILPDHSTYGPIYWAIIEKETDPNAY